MLKSFSSFPDNPALWSIVNGVTADKKMSTLTSLFSLGRKSSAKLLGMPFSRVNVLRNLNLTVSQPR